MVGGGILQLVLGFSWIFNLRCLTYLKITTSHRRNPQLLQLLPTSPAFRDHRLRCGINVAPSPGASDGPTTCVQPRPTWGAIASPTSGVKSCCTALLERGGEAVYLVSSLVYPVTHKEWYIYICLQWTWSICIYIYWYEMIYLYTVILWHYDKRMVWNVVCWSPSQWSQWRSSLWMDWDHGLIRET